MSGCTRCGKCCRDYAIAMARDEEYARFLTYHGLVIRDRPLAANLPGMEVYGQSKCIHLHTDRSCGTKCAIYDQRPAICREFTCESARKEGR